MNKKEKFFSKKRIKEFIMINIGIFLVSFAFTFFLDKNNFIFGGVSGIGIILKNLFILCSSEFFTRKNIVMAVSTYIT